MIEFLRTSHILLMGVSGDFRQNTYSIIKIFIFYNLFITESLKFKFIDEFFFDKIN